MRSLATLACFTLACASAPKTDPEPMSVMPTLPADGSCLNQSGHPRLIRVTPSPVILVPGNIVKLEWDVEAVCGEITLTGLEVRIRSATGAREEDRHALPNMTASPGSPARLHLMFGAREEQPPTHLEIDVMPVWTDAFTRKSFAWAERPASTTVIVTVVRKPSASL